MTLSQGKRALCASLLVVLICSIAPVSQVVAQTIPIANEDTQTIAHSILTEQTSIDDILRFSGETARTGTDIDAVFLSEVCNPANHNYTDIVANADSSVVGFLSTQPVFEAFEKILSLLTESGWNVNAKNSASEGSSSCVATCMKESGNLRWAYISCVSLGNATSIVIQTHG